MRGRKGKGKEGGKGRGRLRHGFFLGGGWTPQNYASQQRYFAVVWNPSSITYFYTPDIAICPFYCFANN